MIVCILIAIFAFWIFVDNFRIVTTHYTIKSEKVNSETKIVQISDFHNSRRMLLKTINTTKKESTDLIFITGDLIDGNRTDIDTAIKLVDGIKDVAPIYFVTGNHEASIPNYYEFESELKKLGVYVLNDEEEKFDEISIIGSKDLYYHSNNSDFEDLSSKIDESKYNILLAHHPELFAEYSAFGYDMVFSGHAHGGQWRIPFIGGLFAPNQGLFPKYDAGMYRIENTKMFVSRGIGNSTFPIRINNPSEIISVTIVPKK